MTFERITGGRPNDFARHKTNKKAGQKPGSFSSDPEECHFLVPSTILVRWLCFDLVVFPLGDGAGFTLVFGSGDACVLASVGG